MPTYSPNAVSTAFPGLFGWNPAPGVTGSDLTPRPEVRLFKGTETSPKKEITAFVFQDDAYAQYGENEYVWFILELPPNYVDTLICRIWGWTNTLSGNIVWGLRIYTLAHNDAHISEAPWSTHYETETAGLSVDTANDLQVWVITPGDPGIPNSLLCIGLHRGTHDAADTCTEDVNVCHVGFTYSDV